MLGGILDGILGRMPVEILLECSVECWIECLMKYLMKCLIKCLVKCLMECLNHAAEQVYFDFQDHVKVTFFRPIKSRLGTERIFEPVNMTSGLMCQRHNCPVSTPGFRRVIFSLYSKHPQPCHASH